MTCGGRKGGLLLCRLWLREKMLRKLLLLLLVVMGEMWDSGDSGCSCSWCCNGDVR